MSKLEKLLNHRNTQIGGKGTPRRKSVRKNQGPSPTTLLNQLDKLLVRNGANPLPGAKTINFLSESEDKKTYHVFNRPQIKYIPTANLMVIQNANLNEENDPKEKSEEIEEIPAVSENTPETKETNEEKEGNEENLESSMKRVPNRREKNIKARILKIHPKMKRMTNQKLDPIGYMEQGEFRWNIEEPEVYHYAGNTYLVFGPVKMGMQEQKTEGESEQNGINLDNFNDINLDQINEDEDEVPSLVQNNHSSNTTTPDGVREEDVQMVMEQVGDCTRDQAISALQNTGGDLVSAILELN